MSQAADFTKMVPGFDFLQNLVKNAGAALPGVGQWVAPTLDPAEIEKRISELRTVQYWLEQNARMIGTTIQALEVQRMTLGTLKTMNVQMEDLRASLLVRGAGDDAQGAAASQGKAGKAGARSKSGSAADALATPMAVDPMQWWGALTQQFNQLAASAVKETSADMARNLAGEMVRQGFDAAGKTLRQTVAMPSNVAHSLSAAGKTMRASAGGTGAAPAPAEANPATRTRRTTRRTAAKR